MAFRSSYDDDSSSSGGFRAAWSRLFRQGENPIGWSLPLFVFRGIMVRLSLLFVLYFITELLGARYGVWYRVSELTMLFTMVLLHEFGHCFACRYVGGEADQILLWPLGGLAMCRPPHRWQADFITTAGGPLVNVAFIPLLAIPLWILTHASYGWAALIFNPFTPGEALGELGFTSYGMVFLWWAYYVNWTLILFNIFVPMFPLDGARMVHALLWSKLGYRRSLQIMVTVGFATAIVLCFIAMLMKNNVLIGIAIFGGFTCYAERQRLAMLTIDDDMDDLYPSFRSSLAPDYNAPRVRAEEAAPSKAQLKRKAKAEAQVLAEQDELDRILAKIAKEGMGSLTKKEQGWLKDATQRRRGN